MDLLALQLDVRQKRAVVRVSDAEERTEVVLDGAAFARVYSAAQPLFDWAHGSVSPSARTPADATLLVVEVDASQRQLRLGYLSEHSAHAEPPSDHQPADLKLVFRDADYDTCQLLLREAARAAVREVRPRKPEPAALSYDDRWEYLYQHAGDGWELGRTPPPLQRYLQEHPPLPGQKLIVLGCGRGHEARLLAQLGQPVGAHVWAVDIAPSAVAYTAQAAAREGLSSSITVLQADLFTLAQQHPEQRGAYDVLVEHCCFCAIEPTRRDEYVQAAAALLRPGGQLVGLFYCHDYPGGPPFGTSAQEVKTRLSAAFEIASATVPRDSILTRAGQELLVVATRRG